MANNRIKQMPQQLSAIDNAESNFCVPSAKGSEGHLLYSTDVSCNCSRMNLLRIFFSLILLTSCVDHKSAGRFGVSNDEEVSINNGFYIAAYIPDRSSIQLLNNSVIKIDTSWAESMWAYNEKGKPEAAGNYGLNFIIPIKGTKPDQFLYTLGLLDKSNEAFTNGIEETRCVLHPANIKEIIEVVLEEKNPDESLGWTKPIVTDTIRFIKIIKQQLTTE